VSLKGHWRLFWFFFSGYARVDKAEYSAYESTLNSSIVSYRVRKRQRTVLKPT